MKSPVPMEDLWLQLKSEATIQILQPLLEKVLSVPATSASIQPEWSDHAPEPRLEKHSSASLCFSNVIATCDCSLLVCEVKTEAQFVDNLCFDKRFVVSLTIGF